MRNFDVYFDIYGKKIKVIVLAKNKEDAKQKVIEKISFHKIEQSNEYFNKSMDLMDDILNILKQ